MYKRTSSKLHILVPAGVSEDHRTPKLLPPGACAALLRPTVGRAIATVLVVVAVIAAPGDDAVPNAARSARGAAAAALAEERPRSAALRAIRLDAIACLGTWWKPGAPNVAAAAKLELSKTASNAIGCRTEYTQAA